MLENMTPGGEAADVSELRRAAYMQETDPLLAKAHRGEATLAKWRAAVDLVRARYPYPDEVAPGAS